MTHTFSIKGVLRHAWHTFRRNSKFLLLVSTVYILISAVPSLFHHLRDTIPALDTDPIFITLLAFIQIAVFVLGLIMPIGYTYIMLRIVDGEHVEVKELFSAHGVFWRFVFTGLLSMLIIVCTGLVGGGLMLALSMLLFQFDMHLVAFIIVLLLSGALMVALWIVSLRLMFASYMVVDRHVRPLVALKDSWHYTRHTNVKLLGFILLIALLNIGGFILFFVGILVTIPISSLASVYVYKALIRDTVAHTHHGA